MLHILLLILKIVGIILAIVLGIIIVLFAVVIFVPIRYEISARCDGEIETLKAKVKATWLLHLLRADVFLKGKKIKWKARFAWIKKSNTHITPSPEDNNNERCNQESQKVEETFIQNDECEKSFEYNKEKQETNQKNNDADQSEDEKTDKDFVGGKISQLIEKIKDLLQKKDKITGFITDQTHVHAFKKIKTVLFVFLKKLKPDKVQGKVRFGFEDPATTGKVLGGISILYPVFGDSLEIIADFENQILKGTLYLKGKIRLCYLVSLVVKLIICKEVRITYKDIRNFKL